MAKDVASRAPSDEAFRERLECAAARFSSIHDRWPAAGDASAPEATDSDAPASGVALGQPDLALPVTEGGVCVTPILGIATDAEEEPRPRFKTLMGVPRSDPDVDELAGLDGSAAPEPAGERASSRSDTAKLQRPTPPPLPSRFLALPEAAPSPSPGSLQRSAATPISALGTLPPRSRSVPAQWSALVQSSPDVALELAALRRSQRRRGWLVGIASFAATLLVFALAAPRERTLALRWLNEEYQSRLQPSLSTVADTARALQPGRVVEPESKLPEPSAAQTVAMIGATSELRRIDERPPPLSVAPDPAFASRPDPSTAATATEVASEPRSESKLGPANPPHPHAPQSLPRNGEGAAPPRATRDKSTARDKSAAIAQSKPQVAAPRKRSTRSAATKAPAPGPTKERATRQNSIRQGGNGGIIRETPF